MNRSFGPKNPISAAKVDAGGNIRLPSMSKCLQFKILPKDQTIIKDFFNMRIMN
jgi:hypothetical protein